MLPIPVFFLFFSISKLNVKSKFCPRCTASASFTYTQERDVNNNNEILNHQFQYSNQSITDLPSQLQSPGKFQRSVRGKQRNRWKEGRPEDDGNHGESVTLADFKLWYFWSYNCLSFFVDSPWFSSSPALPTITLEAPVLEIAEKRT